MEAAGTDGGFAGGLSETAACGLRRTESRAAGSECLAPDFADHRNNPDGDDAGAERTDS